MQIVEVGPRDGLQNESRLVTTEEKRRLIEQLIDAGLRRIEVASFVNPRRVPQMADAEALLSALPKNSLCSYIGLVLNARGAQRAITTPVNEIGTAIPASDTFGTRNQGQTTSEAILEIARIVKVAKAKAIPVQCGISMAFGCPFEGAIPVSRVVDVVRRIADLGLVEVALADTIGAAVPAQVTELFGRVHEAIPHVPLRAHFHDTRNMGVANVWAAIQAGVKSIDASVAGLGGCPFAPGATGNVPTEDIVYLLERSGIWTGIDLNRLIDIARSADAMLGRPVTSALGRAGLPQLPKGGLTPT